MILDLLDVLMESIQELDVVNRSHVEMVRVSVKMRRPLKISVMRLLSDVPMALTTYLALAFKNNQTKVHTRGPLHLIQPIPTKSSQHIPFPFVLFYSSLPFFIRFPEVS